MTTRLPRLPVLIAVAGCLIGLLLWPRMPELRFLVTFICIVVPVAVYAAGTSMWRSYTPKWLQFRLTSVLVLVLFTALAIKAWQYEPYHKVYLEQDRLIRAVQQRGGVVDTEPVGPAMLKLRRVLAIRFHTPIENSDLEELSLLPGCRTVKGLTRMALELS